MRLLDNLDLESALIFDTEPEIGRYVLSAAVSAFSRSASGPSELDVPSLVECTGEIGSSHSAFSFSAFLELSGHSIVSVGPYVFTLKVVGVVDTLRQDRDCISGQRRHAEFLYASLHQTRVLALIRKTASSFAKSDEEVSQRVCRRTEIGSDCYKDQ